MKRDAVGRVMDALGFVFLAAGVLGARALYDWMRKRDDRRRLAAYRVEAATTFEGDK